VLAVAGAAKAEPAMWTVRGPHATVILFGSIHLLPKGLNWESPALRAAVARANEIWFELPMDPATADQVRQQIADRGALPRGDSLFNHLTAAEGERVKAICAKLGVPPTLVATMRPWLAEVTLSLIQDMKAGAEASSGVEQQISSQAPAGARLQAFETVKDQVGFLADTSPAGQAASLDETLGEIQNDPNLFGRVVDEWMDGDLKALSKDALDSMEGTSPEMYRRLITGRNRRWAARLAGRLQGDGVVVVVVGVGHLIGPGGVPALLRARGFRVEGPEAH
jgi:uncharacterized protein YbaP (TraB family)